MSDQGTDYPDRQRKPKCIEAVVFDLDDTLLDWSQPALSWEEFTRPMARNIFEHLQHCGQSLPEESEFRACLRVRVQHVWDEAKKDWSGASFADALRLTLADCNVDAGAVDIDELLRVYDWQPMPGVELYDDVHDVLSKLKHQGYKIGLITNSFFPMWMRDVELRHYDLIDYFDARITSGDTGYMKPHPAIYQRVLQLLDVPAGRAIFIGDRPQNDIAGANEAGMYSVLIDPPHLNRERDGIEADATITNLRELFPILERLESQC
jgi:putative hydrolase of the HAD superfamily